MKNISKDKLKKYERSFNQNENKVITNAVTKNGFFKSCENYDEIRNARYEFSVNLKQGNITNQKQSGRCWIFASTNFLRYFLIKKLNISTIELSQNYIAFYDKLEKCNYFLNNIIDTIDRPTTDRHVTFFLDAPINDGGQWDMFLNIIKKYGIVPKSAMPETYSSSNTSEINKILRRILRMYAYELRTSYKKKKNLEDIENQKLDMLENIYAILCTAFGRPPEKFDFEYTDKNDEFHRDSNITPTEFYDKYISEELSNYVVLVNWPLANYPMNQTYTSKYVYNVVGDKQNIFVNVPIKEIKSALIKSLKDNKISWFACDVLASSLRQDGYLATEILDYDNLFSVKLNFDKGDRMMLRDSLCNHAMTFTGVNLDFRNKPNRWKVQNSWGELAGFKGYYVMSDNWFDEYVYEVVVEKQYLSEEVLKALETTPIELDPWSPVC